MRKRDDMIAEPLGDRNDDLRRRHRLVVLLGDEILIALDTGLGFGLAGLGARRDPFGLGFELAPARLLLAAFLAKTFLLLIQPGGIIAFVGDAAAAIEFENPPCYIVEKIAVVGDDQDRAGISAQMSLKPVDRLRVEMVGRLVEEQKLRLFKKQLAERDAAALAAGKCSDRRIAGRTAERVHCLIDLRIEIPKALGLDLVLQSGHFIGGLVGIVHRELIVAVEDRLFLGDALNHIAARIKTVVELWLLRQIADARAFGDETLAGKLLVDPGHDPQKRRFARPVNAEDADLGVGIEGKIDIFQDLFFAWV